MVRNNHVCSGDVKMSLWYQMLKMNLQLQLHTAQREDRSF